MRHAGLSQVARQAGIGSARNGFAFGVETHYILVRSIPFGGDCRMTIKVGDKLPEATFKVMKEGKPADMTVAELTAGKKVALFAVPGAFTPTCSVRHLPGYKEKAAEMRAKGVDAIACVSVNDVFVMNAWGKDQQVGEDVIMLADGNGAFANAVGLVMDGSGFGLGSRSQRYSMVVENGVVKQLNVEAPGEFKVSAADYMLGQL
jgi:glutaredoxin/glutathione-dependent peroxiredoxin